MALHLNISPQTYREFTSQLYNMYLTPIIKDILKFIHDYLRHIGSPEGIKVVGHYHIIWLSYRISSKHNILSLFSDSVYLVQGGEE